MNRQLEKLFLGAGVLILIVPLLIFVYFSLWVPFILDDVAYANVVTHHGFWKSQLVWVIDWNGRFAANFLTSLFFTVFDFATSRNYCGVISIASLTFVAYHFSANYIDSKSILKRTYFVLVILSLLTFSISYSFAALTWVAASVAYLSCFIFSYFAWWFTSQSSNRESLAIRALAVLFTALAVSSSESGIFIWAALHTSFLIYLRLDGRLKFADVVGYLLCICFIVFMLNMPGYVNQVSSYGIREGGGRLLFSIKSGFVLAFKGLIRDYASLCVASLLLLVFDTKKHTHNFSVKRMLGFLFITLGAYFVVNVGGYYRTGGEPPPRVETLVSYISAFIMFRYVFHFMGLLKKKLDSCINVKSYVFKALLILVIPILLTITHWYQDHGLFRRIINEIETGSSYTLYHHSKATNRALSMVRGKNIHVTIPIPYELTLVQHVRDLNDHYRDDPSYWVNINLAQYFGIKSVSYQWTTMIHWRKFMNEYSLDYLDNGYFSIFLQKRLRFKSHEL